MFSVLHFQTSICKRFMAQNRLDVLVISCPFTISSKCFGPCFFSMLYKRNKVITDQSRPLQRLKETIKVTDGNFFESQCIS